VIAGGCRRADIPVTYLCHNIVDHEATRWKRALARTVLKHGSHCIVQSETEAARLRDLVPDSAVTIHGHPVYGGLPEPSLRMPRRSPRELLFFGLIRPYKGLDLLIEAWQDFASQLKRKAH
jgi:glycosyltransferase involved in cell wall biosynthesis